MYTPSGEAGENCPMASYVRPPVSIARRAGQLAHALVGSEGPFSFDDVPPVSPKVIGALSPDQIAKYERDAALAVDFAYFGLYIEEPERVKTLQYKAQEFVADSKAPQPSSGRKQTHDPSSIAMLSYIDLLDSKSRTFVRSDPPELRKIRFYADVMSNRAGPGQIRVEGHASSYVGLSTLADALVALNQACIQARNLTKPIPEVLQNSMGVARFLAALEIDDNRSLFMNNRIAQCLKARPDSITINKAKAAKIIERRAARTQPQRTQNACPGIGPISCISDRSVNEILFMRTIKDLELAGAWAESSEAI